MPIADTTPHSLTKRTAADPYGCSNGKRPENPVFSDECRYDHSLTDPRCSECEHKGTGEAYDKMIRSNAK